MKKLLCICLLLSLLVSPVFGCFGAVYVSEPTNTFGFNNGSYIGFLNDIVFDDVELKASDDASFPSYVFFTLEGSTAAYGFYCDSVNVTVNNYFGSNVLELACVASGAGAVYVYVADKGAPVSHSGGDSVVYSTLLKVVTITVSVSGTVQLNWNPADIGGGGGGGEITPTITPTFAPSDPDATPAPTSSVPSGILFEVEPVFFGEVQPNSSVIIPLRFHYSGSSFTLQSLSLPEPFNSWYVPASNFSYLTFVLGSSGASLGEVNLLFNVPSDAVEGSYSGTFTLSARDGFGSIRTSTGVISTEKESIGGTFMFPDLLLHPLYIVLIVLAILTVIFFLILFMRKKRRR